MSQVLQRLKKLEARMTDRSGHAPHSNAWLAHWGEKLDQFLTEGDSRAISGMPLAALDEIVEKGKPTEP